MKRYKRFYKTLPSLSRRRGKTNDVYEFTIDRPELCSFTEFRKQQQSQKRTEKSAALNLFDSSEQFDVNQNSSTQPDREIVQVKSSKKVENVIRAKEITSTSNQKSSHQPGNETQKPEPTKKNKNRGITITCTAQVHATQDEPVALPAIGRNKKINSGIGAESGTSSSLTTPMKSHSDSENIRRIFTEIDSWDERLATINDISSLAENEIVNVPCRNDKLFESTAPEEFAPEEPATDIAAHVDEGATIASQEKEISDLQNRNHDFVTCESQMSKLFAEEEVSSQLPSSCELNSRSAHASTSKIAARPPLSITRTSRRFEKSVIEELSDIESVLESRDPTACSNMEKVSPEIEKLMRDVSVFRMTAQKVPNLSDLAERPKDFEFHISSHEELSECSNDNLKTTNSQLVSQDSETSRILQSNENREVAEVLDANLDQFVPPSAENAFEKSDSREHISNALVPDDDFQTEEPSSNVHERLSATDRHSDSPIVLPTPESECYLVSDSQPSQNRESATMPNEKPLEQEISSPLKNKIASQKQRTRKKSNSLAVDIPTITKLQKNATSHSYHSDSDEEFLFRANKRAPLKASESINCQPKPGKKSAASAGKIKKPAKISVGTQSRSNLTKYEKNVRKLTDFVHHKIMKNASTSKVELKSETPCRSRSNEKRKLYTDTDDEVFLAVGKRRRKFRTKYTEETTSEADSVLLPSISEASQESYKGVEPKSFLSVSEKMELLSLRASATHSSLTPPTRRVITVSPALFNTTDEKSTPKTAGSASKSSYTPPDVITRNASPLQKSSSPLVNQIPERLVRSDPNSKGSSNQTKVTGSEANDNYWSRSSSPVSSNKRTMKYINESVKECLHLPRTPDSIPSQYLSALTSEKESDTSPPQVMRKHRRMQTLKQRNVKINYRLCLDSDSSSDDCYDLASTKSQKNDVSETNRVYKLYIPKEVVKRDQQRQNSSQSQLNTIPNKLSDSDDRSEIDISDIIIPPELCQSTETPVLTQVPEESRPAQLSNSASSRHRGDGNIESARKRIGFFTDDEYESDALTINLDDNLIRMQFPPKIGW